ncbi:MCE family protein [Mycolicibacterium moriokaense]|nr:MCE family protein [Mycolicibacterium moriokaense]
MRRFKLKPLDQRNPVAVGIVGTLLVAGVTVAVFQYDKLPFISGTRDYTAYFTESGGIKPGSHVRASGLDVGEVSSVRLDGAKVRVDFTVKKSVELGDRTEAAIKTETVLGAKNLELTPRGEGRLSGPIPIERTQSPYDLPDALGDLTTTISGLDTRQLSGALTTLADTLRGTPPDLKLALEGTARLSDTLNKRDSELRRLLSNANAVTGVLAKRSEQVAGLVTDSNILLTAVLQQRDSLDALMTNLTAVSKQISGLVDDNRAQLKPALDNLNGVLKILDDHKQDLQRVLFLFNRYAMTFGEVLGSGPFFKAYLANLLPGQLVQPFTDVAFSDLGLDPNTMLPSQLTDPPTGQPATPALPMPFPRTGQGGEPHLTLPDAITGKPGDPRYPYRQPPPAPPPGGPPPGPPAEAAPNQRSVPTPSPSPVFVPAPGEIPPLDSPPVSESAPQAPEGGS